MQSQTTDQEKARAIQYAITDAGLTKDEAEEAFYNYYPEDENKYCDTCGKKLNDSGENKNCNDDIEDDFCTECWKKFEERLNQFK